MTDHVDAKPGAYSRLLGDIPLPRGGVAVFDKPRGTRHHQMLSDASGFIDAITLATNRARLRSFRAHRKVLAAGMAALPEERREAQRGTIQWCDTAIASLEGEVCGDGDVEVTVAPSEVRAVCEYLAEHTKRLKGVDDVPWDAYGPDERVEFYDLLGPDIGTVLAAVITALNELSTGGHRG